MSASACSRMYVLLCMNSVKQGCVPFQEFSAFSALHVIIGLLPVNTIHNLVILFNTAKNQQASIKKGTF